MKSLLLAMTIAAMLLLAACGTSNTTGEASSDRTIKLPIGKAKTIGDVTFTCKGFSVTQKNCVAQCPFLTSNDRYESDCDKQVAGTANFDLKVGGAITPASIDLGGDWTPIAGSKKTFKLLKVSSGGAECSSSGGISVCKMGGTKYCHILVK